MKLIAAIRRHIRRSQRRSDIECLWPAFVDRCPNHRAALLAFAWMHVAREPAWADPAEWAEDSELCREIAAMLNHPSTCNCERDPIMHPHNDRVSLTNRDGDTAEVPRALVRIGPEPIARDVTPDDLEPATDVEPTPAWVWLMCGFVIAALLG